MARGDAEFWDDDHLLRHLKERLPDLTDADIAALGATDAAVQHYLDVVARTTARRAETAQQHQDVRELSYAQLKQHIEAKQPLGYLGLKRWGRSASAEDCEAAARDLLRQDEPRMLTNYLAIFNERAFPPGPQPLLPYVWHDTDRVARRTLDALSLFRDLALHDFGLELLRANRHTGDALGLFILNYQAGDDAVFTALLDAAQTDEDIHGIGFGLLDVMEKNRLDRARDLLLTLYERQPCALCRAKVVEQLAALHALPAWMLHECQHDAEDETRDITQRYLAEHQRASTS